MHTQPYKYIEMILIEIHLVEHFFKVMFGVHPRGNSITEENEILYNTSWVHIYHVTHSTESRIFFFIVTDIPQGSTPMLKQTFG